MHDSPMRFYSTRESQWGKCSEAGHYPDNLNAIVNYFLGCAGQDVRYVFAIVEVSVHFDCVIEVLGDDCLFYGQS